MVTYIKRIKIFGFLISANFVFSQNIQKIRESDTIYVYFKKDLVDFKQVSDEKMHAFNYLNNNGHYNTIRFHNYSNINNVELKKKKRILKKYKDIIIDYNFLKSFSYEEATLLFDKKIVFLIDKEDFCWFTLKLIKVKIAGFSPLSIE